MGLGIAIAVGGKTDPELALATTVEVYECLGQAMTYSIRYDVDISEGDLPLLVDGRVDAGSELSILIPVEDKMLCLVKGPVHGQNIHIEHGGAGSWAEIRGSDTSIIMDRATKSVVWSDVKDSDAVQSILSNYGYTPDVQITSAGHFENKHVLIQRESDLSFIRRLARRNGFHFWVTSDEFGTETAHFKRPPLEGGVSAELVINLDSPNLASLDIEWDVERPTSMEGKQLDLNSKTDMDVAVSQTPQSVLGDRGLNAITGDIRSVHLSAPADDAGDMQARGEAALIEADWFIRANCQTTLENLGALVRAHTVIELRGAGSRFSGKYFVAGVRHSIDAKEHRMELELVRNGWGG
jgi:phage protein D